MKVTLTKAVAALLIFFAQTCAQTQTARLVGTIHDASGAVIPNARISATQVGTNKTSATAANSTGEYVLAASQPGAYFAVEAPGFRKAVVNGLQLDAASNMSQSVTLEIGQVAKSSKSRQTQSSYRPPTRKSASP